MFTAHSSSAVLLSLLAFTPLYAYAQTQIERPEEFVYLRDIDSTIIQDMRYAGDHNFVGHPLPGYEKAECLLTRPAANALASIQAILKTSQLSLKVYDCYRPQRAVYAFIVWSQDDTDQLMKSEFYPDLNKSQLFELNYLNQFSSHSRGSAVDLTIVALPAADEPIYQAGQTLVSCAAPHGERYADNSLDMGTGYDCFDVRANPGNSQISDEAKHHRETLTELMTYHGFAASQTEWWHFKLIDEPFPQTYFDFNVE